MILFFNNKTMDRLASKSPEEKSTFFMLPEK